MNDKAPCPRSCHRRQFLLRSRRPIHAPSAARTGTDKRDNSRCWWLWTWLSPWAVWRMPSQRLLRRRVLRWRCSGARRGSSPRCGGCPTGRGSTQVPSSLQPIPMLDGLLTDLKVAGHFNSLTRHELAQGHLRVRRHKTNVTNHAGVVHLSMTPALCNLLPQIRQPNIGTVACNQFLLSVLARASAFLTGQVD